MLAKVSVDFPALLPLSVSLRFSHSSFCLKVKPSDDELSRAIKGVDDVIISWNNQAKDVRGSIRQFFEQLKGHINTREAELLGEVEKERLRKEKELVMQRIELQSLLKEVRVTVGFSEDLLAEGNFMEIASSHKPVMERFWTLEDEMKKVPLLPITSVLSFSGGEGAVEEIMKTGEIFAREVSFEKSRVIRSGNGNAFVPLNQKYSLGFTFVDKNGEELIRDLGSFVEVKVDGPSKNVQVPTGNHSFRF